MAEFVKQRPLPAPGSIAEALDIFGNEVRFYREIARDLAVRVPQCYRAGAGADGTLLVLEDLSRLAGRRRPRCRGPGPVSAAPQLGRDRGRSLALAAARGRRR